MNSYEIIIGVAAGMLFAIPFWKKDRQLLIRLSSIGLLVAAVIYVIFAIVGLFSGTSDWSWFVFEVGGVIAYGSMAFLGIRKNGFYAGVGWLLHIFWDLGFHVDKDFVPHFYPGVCLGFDALLALFTFYWSMSDNRE